jgi:hypothetical protein
MTDGARGIPAVRLEPLAHGPAFAVGTVLLESGNVGRWSRWRRAEQVLEQPSAANDG